MRLIIIPLFLFLFLSCKRKKDTVTDDSSIPSLETGPPVETQAPNTSYQPAFDGQTRAGSIITKTEYEATLITTALNSPWGIAVLPDGRMLISEKDGTMRIVSNTGNVSAEITGIPTVYSGGQGGLLGLCLDPDFTQNRMVYWVYAEKENGKTSSCIAKGRLSDDEKQIESPMRIYKALPSINSTLHYGGRILFDADGYLIASTGERSILASRPLAQDLSTALGKIIRIKTDGTPAQDNPLASSGALPEILTYGHRNPQGLAIHPVTGKLWSSEFGPRGGDEINSIEAAKDYGWPTISYGIEYGGAPVGDGITVHAGMEQPVYYWDPSVSPSGITFYKGTKIPEWENNLFICCLSGQHIIRLHINEGKVLGEERLLEDEHQRFRDIVQGTDQALYAITDAGRLYRIDSK